MRKCKYGFTLLVAIVCLSFSSIPQTAKVDFLIGTWKVEGKETYEFWKKEGSALVGESYKKRGGQKYVSETLKIELKENKLVYTATVKNQNQGKGIPFTLLEMENGTYSFENADHDFPKKIQYQRIDKSTLKVSVLGEGDKGFSFQMKKID